MKWIKYKKAAAIFFLIMFSFSLAGFSWGKKSVDLLKKNLIDLDKAIEAARWGTDEKNADSEKDKTDKDSSKTGSASNNKSYVSTIKVRIYGKKIFIDGEECNKEDIEKKIKEKYSGNQKLIIIDDYAEAHVYRAVDELLVRLSDAMGFEYEEGN